MSETPSLSGQVAKVTMERVLDRLSVAPGIHGRGFANFGSVLQLQPVPQQHIRDRRTSHSERLISFCQPH
jgi:hypothetical protein